MKWSKIWIVGNAGYGTLEVVSNVTPEEIAELIEKQTERNDALTLECEPDGRSIVYYDPKGDGDADWKYYEFRFQPKRKEKLED